MGQDPLNPIKASILSSMMKFLPLLVLPFLISMPAAADEKKRPNVLLICIDDLRPELRCFGVDYIESPHIDSLAEKGRIFRRHYV